MTERKLSLFERLFGRPSTPVGPPEKSEADASREKDVESVQSIRRWVATAWPERERPPKTQGSPWAVYHWAVRVGDFGNARLLVRNMRRRSEELRDSAEWVERQAQDMENDLAQMGEWPDVRERSADAEADVDVETDAKSVLGRAHAWQRAQEQRASAEVATGGADGAGVSSGPTLLQRLEAGQASARPPLLAHPSCAAHVECGPLTRVGHTGHGHGPDMATGLWCWHFDEWYLGRPGEVAEEGSNLAARRAQQAALYGGDPFVHKTYPTNPWGATSIATGDGR